MGDHNIKTKHCRYKLENAVDMSAHLEEVIVNYTRKNSFCQKFWSPSTPSSKPDSSQVTAKAENGDMKPSVSVTNAVQPDTDNQSSPVALTPKSTSSVTAVKQHSPSSQTQPEQTKKKYVHVYKHKCPHCSYVDYTHNRLNTHIHRQHAGKVAFQCDLCTFDTETLDKLTAHKRKVHPNEKTVCPICGEVRKSDHTFIEHFVDHAVGANPNSYRCIIKGCNYIGNRARFKFHLKMHGNVMRLTRGDVKRNCFFNKNLQNCTMCPFSANKASTLKLHVSMRHRGATNGNNADVSCQDNNTGSS